MHNTDVLNATDSYTFKSLLLCAFCLNFKSLEIMAIFILSLYRSVSLVCVYVLYATESALKLGDSRNEGCPISNSPAQLL